MVDDMVAVYKYLESMGSNPVRGFVFFKASFF